MASRSHFRLRIFPVIRYNIVSPTPTWISKMLCQPSAGWDDVITYSGWKDVPSVYLVCESDAVLPAPMQLEMAEMVEMAGSEIVRCAAGHMVMLSQLGLFTIRYRQCLDKSAIGIVDVNVCR
ncbi:hypothetical protein V1515DRAFT_360610 [Lipomyces mesembrius]